jgi:hypothetical protein
MATSENTAHQSSEGDAAARQARVDRLLDAIELVKQDEREEARRLLRDLIREDNDFEDAWLWMSVAVDTLDQSGLCLDNVLRINPDNALAASALSRLRESEMRMAQRRARFRGRRDAAFVLMWLIIFALLFAVAVTIFGAMSRMFPAEAMFLPMG